MFSIDGLVSGFDTTSIVESLLQFQQTQVDLFNVRKNEISTRQSAFGGIEAQLLGLRTAVGKLNRINSVFDARTTTSSNESVLTAAASSNASTGSYSITVNKLATAHQIGSQGFEDANSEISTGEISLRVGSREETTIQLDGTNNTVSGLAEAINAQSDDVSASVIFDQGSDSYRILLTSSETGSENAITLTTSYDGNGTEPDFTGPAVQEASNAEIVLGSGGGAIVAEYASNVVDELIPGVTLNLLSVAESQPVNVNIAADTSAAAEAIEGFVDAFNSVVEFIENQTAFDPETNFASPLLGNRNVNLIQNRLLNSVIENVPGLSTGLSRLADIGIDIDTRGRLEVDSTQLNSALTGGIQGVDPSEIRNLFGLNGSSSNQGIEFLLGSDLTAATGEPIEVDIIQAAEQATILGGAEIESTVVVDETNNEFTISVDGESSETLTLPPGTYTQEEIAQQLQSVINNSSSLGNRNVTVGINNNRVVITTESYGSNSEVSSFTGRLATVLKFSGDETDNGQDVAGTFIINGQTETAIGSGQRLSGEIGNENTADLQILVSLSADQVDSGLDGTLTVTRGISSSLDQFLADVLDPETGTLNTINEDFDSQIESIDQSIQRVVDITAARREALVAEFAALESVLARLQNTGNLLSSQLASLNSFGNSN